MRIGISSTTKPPRITDRFRSEHADFRGRLASLDRLRDLGAKGATIVGEVRALSSPLLDHAEREERALFPALAGTLGGEDGPLAVLAAEHHQLHDLIERMLAAPPFPELEPLVRAFVALLHAHIAKEEGVLFPAAEAILGDERLRDLDVPSGVLVA